jgi:hypothetical protein
MNQRMSRRGFMAAPLLPAAFAAASAKAPAPYGPLTAKPASSSTASTSAGTSADTTRSASTSPISPSPAQSNVLLVRVDATQSDGWFYEGAGIYRHVWLVKTTRST